MSSQESTPLLANSGESNSYYFVNKDGGGQEEINGGAEVEEMPVGANADEFEPRILGNKHKVNSKFLYISTYIFYHR